MVDTVATIIFISLHFSIGTSRVEREIVESQSNPEDHSQLSMSSSSRSRRMAASLDMYRKVPVDLMEGTKRGSILSYLALLTIATLFVLETNAFFTRRQVVNLQLDSSSDTRIRVNFNITMMDLSCEWAVVDVVSTLGTDQNVTAQINKWPLDADGVRQRSSRAKKTPEEISLKDETVKQTIEELHANGEDAISLDAQTLKFAQDENDYLFVDFYASWCNHCRDLAPTWEALAELMLDASHKLGNQHPDDITPEDYQAAEKVLPVMVAKIDCVDHHDLCIQQEIRAYPTLRLFVDGEKYKDGDYRGHRNLLNMVEWLYLVEMDHKGHMDESERKLHAAHEAARERLLGPEGSQEEKKWHENILRQQKATKTKEATWVEAEHPGCNLQGHLLLDRTPGNFHVQARSQNQEFAAHMTNVSHLVHSLSVGDSNIQRLIDTGRAKTLPNEVLEKLAPMDGNVYVTNALHESYHHYLKLISTSVEGFKYGPVDVRLFQMLKNSQLAYYRNDTIPEAKFIYDLSPIAVSYGSRSRHWYEYCTSIMAIIGGVFTVVGMIESGIHVTVKAATKRRSPTFKRPAAAVATPYR